MKIIMVGPDPKMKGGIATLERNILENAKDESFEYSMHVARPDGNIIAKLILVPLYTLSFIFKIIAVRYDIAHIHISENWGFYRNIPFVLISKIRDMRVIIHSHACEFDSFYERQNDFIKKLIIYILNKADCIITVSEEWGKVFQSISKSRVEVIKNFINVPDKNYYNCDSKYIVTTGEIEKRKGYYDLVKVIPEICKENKRLRFIFCGNGEIEKIELEVNNLNIDGCVKITGWLSNAEIKKILNDTMLFVLPSYNEGMPMAILEAMSYGIPIISTKVGGIPGLVEDGVNGILIEPGDLFALKKSIERLINDKTLRMSMSGNNYAKIKMDFGPENGINKIYKIYREIM